MPEAAGMFNPNRLSVARKRQGLTKTDLAKRARVDLRSVTAYEAGVYPPKLETAESLAAATKFPLEFLYGDDLDEPQPDTASFRAMSKMTATQRDMALSQGTIALHLSRWLETRFELPELDLPDLSREDSPEAAADSLRRHWGIGELPVRNMIHLLEAKGVRIFSLAINAREVDAFSLWKDITPFVFLNGNKSSEHSRYDAAHELGHLVLHRHGTPQGRDSEREADRFASTFLMPTSSIIAHAMRNPSLPDLIKLKVIWIVSVAALNRRLYSAGMISDWQYRTLCIEIAKRGYRKHEPREAPREMSHILPSVFGALYEDGIGRADVAKALKIPRSELEQLMFGLTMTSIDGGRNQTGSPVKAKLTVVE
ncbi:MAG TPA: ImmA/IrrE family metallo-endopeptidase [Verrucomicrobiae bacterium]|nr:ImmA/IrrE family metallo-endopeptidase [Verrucomicrobiae bacterium]